MYQKTRCLMVENPFHKEVTATKGDPVIEVARKIFRIFDELFMEATDNYRIYPSSNDIEFKVNDRVIQVIKNITNVEGKFLTHNRLHFDYQRAQYKYRNIWISLDESLSVFNPSKLYLPDLDLISLSITLKEKVNWGKYFSLADFNSLKPVRTILDEEEKEKMPKIKKVIFNKPATIVMWEDNTKTVVKCGEDEQFDEEKGLAMAIVKKINGNKGNFNEIFKKYCPSLTNELTRHDKAQAIIEFCTGKSCEGCLLEEYKNCGCFNSVLPDSVIDRNYKILKKAGVLDGNKKSSN